MWYYIKAVGKQRRGPWKRNEEKLKKVLDKATEMWYDIKAAFESGRFFKEERKTFEKGLTNRVKYDILKKLHKTLEKS